MHRVYLKLNMTYVLKAKLSGPHVIISDTNSNSPTMTGYTAIRVNSYTNYPELMQTP